jgi:hypothetical protein
VLAGIWLLRRARKARRETVLTSTNNQNNNHVTGNQDNKSQPSATTEMGAGVGMGGVPWTQGITTTEFQRTPVHNATS